MGNCDINDKTENGLEHFLNFISNFNTDISTNDMHEEHASELLELIMRNFNLLSNKDKLKFMLTDISGTLSTLVKEQSSVNEEYNEMEQENKLEMIRLKSWIVKFVIISVFIVLLLGVGGTMLFSKDGKGEVIMGFAETFFSFINLIFGG